jgi:hypothetical protein
MRPTLALLALLLLVAGCGGANSAGTIATATPAPQTIAVAAAAPHSMALTSQKVVWECPVCEMDYDGPGRCAMGCAELVKYDVAYVCPVDQQAVAGIGKCPRCEQGAKVIKTASLGVAGVSTAPSNAFTN